MAKRKQYDGPCPIERVITIFGGKWKSAILYHLQHEGTLRFSELRRLIPEISQRMLTQQLRELQRDGLVLRKQYPEIPVRVEYSSTDLGHSLLPVGKAIEKWGHENMTAVQKARKKYDTQNM